MYKKDVYINPTFANELKPIMVGTVFVENNQVKFELRKFYPQFYPFAVLECHLHGENIGSLCTVEEFKNKLRDEYGDAINQFEGEEIRCPHKPDAGLDLPRTDGEDREPYVYPGGWDYEKCVAMVKKAVTDDDVAFAHRVSTLMLAGASTL